MAQFKVGDKVRVKNIGDAIIAAIEKDELVVKFANSGSFWVPSGCVSLIRDTLSITATLTTETIPTELLKQLSESGFLITIKAV